MATQNTQEQYSFSFLLISISNMSGGEIRSWGLGASRAPSFRDLGPSPESRGPHLQYLKCSKKDFFVGLPFILNVAIKNAFHFKNKLAYTYLFWYFKNT